MRGVELAGGELGVVHRGEACFARMPRLTPLLSKEGGWELGLQLAGVGRTFVAKHFANFKHTVEAANDELLQGGIVWQSVRKIVLAHKSSGAMSTLRYSSGAMRRKSGVERALQCVWKGRARAPPAVRDSMGVSTCTQQRSEYRSDVTSPRPKHGIPP